MAHKKGGGKTKNGRKTIGRRLGVKVYGDAYVTRGSIIIRQRGTKFQAGEHVVMGRDHTCNATIDGYVFFKKKKKGCLVSVIPKEAHLARAAN